jgi:hypothetical protein
VAGARFDCADQVTDRDGRLAVSAFALLDPLRIVSISFFCKTVALFFPLP